MDSDLVIGIFMIIVWFVSSLIARFGRKRAPEAEIPELEAPPATRQPAVPQRRPRQPPSPPPVPPKAVTVQQALRDLAKQMGIEVEVQPAEQPVASEHARTVGEHRRTEIETHQTLSEQTTTLEEHRRTASEAMRTASEGIFEAPEHRFTPSEHRRGDAMPTARRLSAPGRAHRRGRSKLANQIQADLAAGGGSLARAIVLREILGPPVGLRPPGQDRA